MGGGRRSQDGPVAHGGGLDCNSGHRSTLRDHGRDRMPSRQSLDAFIAQVVGGDHVGAIRDWYHDDAWMQENQAAPRQGGRAALMQQEAAMLASSQSVETELLGGPMIEGDQVA